MIWKRIQQVIVIGPDDQCVHTNYLKLPDKPAFVELASACGINPTCGRRPRQTHTRRFGQTIAAALDAGAERLMFAIGGSASTDGGVGVLRELGAQFDDSSGTERFETAVEHW